MEFSLKTKLVTGYGCLKKIGEIVQSFGVKKVLLCTDAFLLQTPAAHTIQRELEERGIGCVVYDQPQSEPTDVQKWSSLSLWVGVVSWTRQRPCLPS